MKRRNLRRIALAAALGAVTLAGCNDNTGPTPWSVVPDTVTLYSLSRPEHFGLPAAFDFSSLGGSTRAVVVEAPTSTGQWDIAVVDGTAELELAPAGIFDGITATPAIVPITGQTFEELAKAPSDEKLYNDAAAVSAAPGLLYVIRSRQVSRCIYYAKLETLSQDLVAGTLTFRYMANVNCNDRSLIPPGVN